MKENLDDMKKLQRKPSLLRRQSSLSEAVPDEEEMKQGKVPMKHLWNYIRTVGVHYCVIFFLANWVRTTASAYSGVYLSTWDENTSNTTDPVEIAEEQLGKVKFFLMLEFITQSFLIVDVICKGIGIKFHRLPKLKFFRC